MLLRFGVSNRLSMRDRQELALTASSLKDPTGGLIDCPPAPSGSVLPAVLIYGANASGKSNLVDSIRIMREMVLGSHRKGNLGGGVQARRPFALDPASPQNPTRFDVDFVMEGVRYHYGFEASDEAFLSEWLCAFPRGYRRTLFEREGSDFHFGRALGWQNRTITALVRPNSLYVSAAAQNGHEMLSRVFAYFQVDLWRQRDGHPRSSSLVVLRRGGTGRPGNRLSREQRYRNHRVSTQGISGAGRVPSIPA